MEVLKMIAINVNDIFDKMIMKLLLKEIIKLMI